MKKYMLFDHDGVLVDTEFWYELIHEKRHIRQFMDFVLVRENYERAKPHPEPYLTGLKRFGATKEETLVPPRAEVGRGSRHPLCHRPPRLHAFT